jgi:hypothetical protein
LIKPGVYAMGLTAVKDNILTYPIASCDAYYTVESERTIYLKDDPGVGISILGEIPFLGEISSANLAIILLELARTIDIPGNKEKGIQLLKKFGNKIGDALVDHINQLLPTSSEIDRIGFGIESILHSLDADYICRNIKNVKRYEINECPLCSAENISGIINETYNAHYALNSLYKDVVHKIDPSIGLSIFRSALSDHEILLIGGANPVP